MNKRTTWVTFLFALVLVSGCGNHYVTPGGGASMAEFAGLSDQIDDDISKAFETKPAAAFPAAFSRSGQTRSSSVRANSARPASGWNSAMKAALRSRYCARMAFC